MKYPGVLLVLFLGLMNFQCTPQRQSEPQQPNVVLIIADDLGYGDVGVYGGTIIRTPHIDALAQAGVRLTDGYVSAAVCSPSRAGLFTGRYQQRFGYEFNTSGRDTEVGLPLDERTIANMMKAAGYATGLVGKWHLGRRREHHPLSRGFDEYFGVLAGSTSYIDSRIGGVTSVSPGGGRLPTERRNAIHEGFDEVQVEKYLTDVFTEKALDFIDRHRDERFFLVLSHTAPHTPLQATDEYLAGYEHIEHAPTRVYSAMVSALDDSVGAIVSKLGDIGLEENTLVVFLSDNGCASYVAGACSNGPLNGAKRYQFDGGIRIPFILKWPARLPEGKLFEHPANSLDLFSTLASAAGSKDRAQDSVDLLPYLRGEEQTPPHEFLFWRAKPNIAVRRGRWKLWKVNRTELDVSLTGTGIRLLPFQDYAGDSPHGQLTLLYDLSRDQGEQNNRAGDHPDIVNELEEALARWQSELTEPMWPSNRSTLDIIDGVTIQLFF